ncbi:MAG: hypothetical protein HN759_08035 [Akkermansiaceae bacterium]|nr:hypothetical protein [Akkermansiaceae bacterium]
MNPEIFSTIGYLSVICWVVAALLCLIYWKLPSRVLCTLALALTIAGFFFARSNSENYVNRIQLDRSEEIAKQEAMEQARKKALLDSRGDEVAKVRFAEDGAGDYLDRAGMDETDLKYFEKEGVLDKPDWKKNKKKRSGAGADDDSIESAIGGKKVIEGVEDDTFVEDEESKPVFMMEEDMVMANRLDHLNLRVTLVMMIVGILLVLFDYLRRANIHGKSSFPLPLPSSWLNAITPMPPVLTIEKRGKESVENELARLAKRGDSFILLTDNSSRTNKLPASLLKFPVIGQQEHLIPVTGEIDDEFIFESVWYGRSSFVVDSEQRAQKMLGCFLKQLAIRKDARAKVAQTAHIVWDLHSSMPAASKQELEKLAQATGFSVLLIGGKPSSTPEAESNSQLNSQAEPLTS